MKEEIENLAEDVQEYLLRHAENVKMRVVEVFAIMLAGAVIMAAALAVYFLRIRIFVDTLVKHFSRLLSVRKEVRDEQE